jgi:hypothetical protein
MVARCRILIDLFKFNCLNMNLFKFEYDFFLKNINSIFHPINIIYGLRLFHTYFIIFSLSSSLFYTLRHVKKMESRLVNVV